MVGMTGFARLRAERWRGLIAHRAVIQHAPFEPCFFALSIQYGLPQGESLLYWCGRQELNLHVLANTRT